MVSKIAMPSVTLPPGLLMYMEISASGSSISRNRSWATMLLASCSFTSPRRNTTRSLSRREYTSYERSPYGVFSMTLGSI